MSIPMAIASAPLSGLLIYCPTSAKPVLPPAPIPRRARCPFFQESTPCNLHWITRILTWSSPWIPVNCHVLARSTCLSYSPSPPAALPGPRCHQRANLLRWAPHLVICDRCHPCRGWSYRRDG